MWRHCYQFRNCDTSFYNWKFSNSRRYSLCADEHVSCTSNPIHSPKTFGRPEVRFLNDRNWLRKVLAFPLNQIELVENPFMYTMSMVCTNNPQITCHKKKNWLHVDVVVGQFSTYGVGISILEPNISFSGLRLCFLLDNPTVPSPAWKLQTGNSFLIWKLTKPLEPFYRGIATSRLNDLRNFRVMNISLSLNTTRYD